MITGLLRHPCSGVALPRPRACPESESRKVSDNGREKDILEIVNTHFNPYDKPITKLDTVSLTSIKNQAAQEAKKPTKVEDDPEIEEEKKQEQSDIAGEKNPAVDKTTSGDENDASDQDDTDAAGTDGQTGSEQEPTAPVGTTPQEELPADTPEGNHRMSYSMSLVSLMSQIMELPLLEQQRNKRKTSGKIRSDSSV